MKYDPCRPLVSELAVVKRRQFYLPANIKRYLKDGEFLKK